ncbi:MAG: ferrous iron transport protein A [Alphaproteobacteria bacterium]|nr:ferrous iron transport protein A [Alphaproteobacteria bacterium]
MMVQDATGDVSVTLADLRPGQKGQVIRLPDEAIGTNLAALGLVKGAVVALGRKAPLGDPRIYSLLGYQLSLREAEARLVAIKIC